ncbi:MAG: TDT family transporter [Cellulomonas sp.]|nr:TDT family transporter [Cellulomonas sp.]
MTSTIAPTGTAVPPELAPGGAVSAGTAAGQASAGQVAARTGARRWVLRDLTGSPVANITPNWFASVMGTGIVANAAVSLPWQPAGVRTFALVVWLIAATLLVVLLAATALHWRRFPARARGHHLNPVMAHFYGAPPMALLTVGSGAMLVGKDLIGSQAALVLDTVLWSAGTVLGLAVAVVVPYLAFTRHEVREDSAFGGWLMPVVPPMVSAATGAVLLAHLPAGQWRLTLLLACYAMFGISFLAALLVLAQVWGRLMRHKVGPAVMVPTLWIGLGPLGQSVTAVNLLGGHASEVIDPTWAHALLIAGVVFGVPVLGFAMLWAALALAITVRTARAGLPFSLTWWSFTFPVGTCATGAAALAARTGSVALGGLSILLFVGLLTAWAVVAVRTFRGAVLTGTLLA